MATSSITKDFYVKDQQAFDKLKKTFQAVLLANKWLNLLLSKKEEKN